MSSGTLVHCRPPRSAFPLAYTGLAFARRSSLTQSKFPRAAAIHIGVPPSIVWLLTSAPASISSLRTAVLFLSAAAESAVKFSSFRISTSAPCSRSI